MISWRFTPEDVARIRFAFSPLWELVQSLIVLRAPDRHTLHLPWIRATRPILRGLDLTELFALVPVHGITADFLTPPPTTPIPDFADELETVRTTAPDRVLADVEQVRDVPLRILEPIHRDPAAAAERVAGALSAYWERTFEPHWPRIRALLEDDVLWRSRRLAVGGARALFEDLDDTVQWHGDMLTASDAHDYAGELSGEGLLLAPSVMAWPAVRKMIEPYQPMLAYPARGVGTLWHVGPPPTVEALAALLGRARAGLLLALAEPASTTALAHRFSMTPGAVSQQLSILFGAGLVDRSRVGRLVLYRRTTAGDTLAGAALARAAAGAVADDAGPPRTAGPPL